ncbi:phage tail family protein [Lactococcus lactis]|uniref:Phage tail family protein n=1 Tax=Lactococcus lactis TaxID=1358 RepID=A0A9X4S301_9LACT|nr:distal tail protein Dit [Lactococcus lactis]MDG4982043.1 phage tail family protein [Lactococcus lactis]
MINKISILYDSIDIANYVDGVTDINRSIGSGWKNTTQELPNGEDFLYNVRGSKTISFKFFIRGNVTRIAQVRERLAALIDKSVPTPLIFGDEPNKVYYAIPDGDQDLSGEPENPTGTLSFLVPSGVAVSSYTNILNQANSGGINGSYTANADKTIDIIVNNRGTADAYLTFKVTNKSDNASIGIAGPTGVLALGSQDQYLIDTVTNETTRVESQWLLNPSGISQNSNFSGHFNVANDVGNPQNGQLLTAGNLVFKNDGLRLQDGGPPPSGTWSMQGAMQVYNVPADKIGNVGTANFTSTFNIWAQATKMGQTGLMQVLFCDSNNKLMAGLGIYKDDTRGNSFRTQLYIGGNHPRTWKTFGPGGQELNNGGHGDGKVPNPNLYFNSTTGYFTIQKKDRVFNFTFGNKGGNYPITIPELGSTKCTKVFVYMGQLKGRDVNTQYITNLSLRMFNFQKNDVTKIIDSTTDAKRFIPADDHHFGKDEVVVANMATGKIYRGNGTTAANDEKINGSTFYSIPPGESKITIVVGDKAEVPDVEVTWQERFR